MRAVELIGRRAETRALDDLVAAVRTGKSTALVLRGEPGVGKTALMEYLVEHADGYRVLRAAGVQAEMELAYAGLHQALAPVIDHVASLPDPQRGALQTVFGMAAGAAPDRFLVALAVLSLLSAAAEQQPVLCVIDDEQWLDSASAQAFAFVARRLAAESVGVIFAARTASDELWGLPELVVEGLAVADARALLDSVLTAPVDPQIRDQVIGETRGNPLALLELTRGVTPFALAGGFALPGVMPLSGRIEASFRRRLDALPDASRRLMCLAAADPVGEPTVLWNAAAQLGVHFDDAAPAIDAGLIEFATWVQFHHPLVRSAAYRWASVGERQQAHRALAEATDPELDPDRRAWHRAQGAAGPDEEIAEELERSAGRAQARGGMAAAAAFLERAAALTPEPANRARRMLAAATAKRDAGGLDGALGLLVAVEASPLDALQRAQLEYLRGEIAFDQLRVRDAARLLQSAATHFEPLSADAARIVRLQALDATMWLADLDGPDGMRATAAAAQAGPPSPQPPRSVDMLLDALALRYTGDYASAAPLLVRAIEAILATDVNSDDAERWLPLARSKVTAVPAADVWDAESWHAMALGLVHFARLIGTPVYLQFALGYLAWTYVLRGELSMATLLMEENRLIGDVTGTPPVAFVDMLMAAWRGDRQTTTEMIEATVATATTEGLRKIVDFARYTGSVLDNGLGRHESACAAALQAFDGDHVGLAALVIPELTEAASHLGDTDLIRRALNYVDEQAQVVPTPWALGIQARLRAMLATGREADAFYRESLEHLARAHVGVEVARGHLLHGEWLRRENRRVDARGALRAADQMFTAMGAIGFAERARRELRASGETARQRTSETREDLTPQELQVARLARDGFSNAEIGTQLFISARTVQYHLRKVFAKLGIRSRVELTHALPADPPSSGPSG